MEREREGRLEQDVPELDRERNETDPEAEEGDDDDAPE